MNEMIYTFGKRREMNRLLMERFPQHRFEQAPPAGVPRMSCRTLPEAVEQIDSRTALEVAAYRYMEAYNVPLPVFVGIGAGKHPSGWHWDVNYVNPYSQKSVDEATRHILGGRLFAEIL